jgi:hypothetical protein
MYLLNYSLLGKALPLSSAQSDYRWQLSQASVRAVSYTAE